jgi:nucleoside-diphosphate-sugar epimerase
MDVLITGATGYIGGAVAEAMTGAGHTVHALARTSAALDRIASRGWTPVRGDLHETAELQRLARTLDAVVHAANTGGGDAAAVDAEATRALLRALAGTGKPFVYTSGVWAVGAGEADERSAADPPALVGWRAGLEAEIIAAAPEVRSVVLRPGVVYGRGGGIPGMVVRGELPVIGDGRQQWPLVHLDDLSDLYVRALNAPAGSILHGVAHTLSMRDLALVGTVGRGAAMAEMLPLAEARARLGDFADALALDQRVSSRRTRELLGWEPRGPSPVEELLVGSYAVTPPAGRAGAAAARG